MTRRATFRCDAGRELGLGHAMRCRTLASSLKASGWHVDWACRPSAELLQVLGRNPDLALPGEPSFAPLPTAEAETLGTFARGADWIVVDHYGADAAWLSRLREVSHGARVLLFDDHQTRTGADLRLAPLQPPTSQTLSGLEYLMLRAPFCSTPVKDTQARNGFVICIGGTDPQHLTRLAVEQLLARGDQLPELTVLSGDTLLDDVLTRWPVPARRHTWLDADPLARVLAQAEGALVATSGVAFEALAMGAPIVGLQWAINQTQHAQRLLEAGIPVTSNVHLATTLLHRRCAVNVRLSDGGGVRRVVQAMTALVPAKETWAAH